MPELSNVSGAQYERAHLLLNVQVGLLYKRIAKIEFHATQSTGRSRIGTRDGSRQWGGECCGQIIRRVGRHKGWIGEGHTRTGIVAIEDETETAANHRARSHVGCNSKTRSEGAIVCLNSGCC